MRDEFDDLEEFDLDGDGMLDEFEIVLAEEERPTESEDGDDDDWDDDDDDWDDDDSDDDF